MMNTTRAERWKTPECWTGRQECAKLIGVGLTLRRFPALQPGIGVDPGFRLLKSVCSGS